MSDDSDIEGEVDQKFHTTSGKNDYRKAASGSLGPRQRGKNALVEAAVAERKAARKTSKPMKKPRKEVCVCVCVCVFFFFFFFAPA